MNIELEKQLWKIGKKGRAYTRKHFNSFVEALLEDFKQFIGRDFQVDPDLYLDLENPESPNLCVWIWSEEEVEYLPSNVWTAVLGGGIAGIEVNGEVEDQFTVSLTMFLFDKKNKERMSLESGENLIEFSFQRREPEPGEWVNLGWYRDEWGEWDDVLWE